MAVTITVADVKALITTSLPDAVIQGFIDYMDAADDCLDANGVPDAQQTNLKLFGVAHLITLQSQGGAGVKSMSGPLGDSITYDSTQRSAEKTYWGQTLQSIDAYGCVTSLLSDRNSVGTFVVSGC